MKVLVACEESQVVTTAFRDQGHEAFSCDLQPCSGGHPEWHIQKNCLRVINGDCDFNTGEGAKHHQDGPWDLVIAHPPCTYLANVGAPHLHTSEGINKARYALMEKARKFFFEILDCNARHLAVENPTPLRCANLPKPDDVIEPWYFGEHWSKRTLLWLRNLPPLLPTQFCHEHMSYMEKFRDQRKRSRTFPGIARAMAQQWGTLNY